FRQRLGSREQAVETGRLLRVSRRGQRRPGHGGLEVVELELGGLADDRRGLRRIVYARELDHDLVRALLADLGLGDAELVDALALDLDRAGERRWVELLPLSLLRLQYYLEVFQE